MRYNKEHAKEQIKKLLNDFKAHYQSHKNELEANTETKLIEPLFEILGWSKNDFVKQEKAHRGIKTGHADYVFYVNERIVFFLEVKKIGIYLEKEADKQVISYALSKRIPFAISTNFEQLRIFCVEQEKAIQDKFRVFNEPDDYINRFEDLWLLSKESFEQNTILRIAEDEDRLKRRASIDKSLLEDLMHIRKLIAYDIEKGYPQQYEINEKDDIIQRIIDRLVFIRRCEDIGINPDNIMFAEIRHLPDNKAYPKLREMFKKYDDVYNAGLFAQVEDNDCDKINIDGAIIKKLAYYLYESKNNEYIYNFDWIDADVLGQVYEQYLGIILAQTKSGRAKLKQGQAHRKEQGIYYTPTYIVDYIVKNTVEDLIKNRKVKPQEIKILDPACGSGSFLIKAFDYIYKNLASNEEIEQQRIDTQGNYSIKTAILKNNLFGVDLDNKATEITKLNLLLKAAEKGRKLPKELEKHIKQGNSLIDDESVVKLNAFKWRGEFQEASFDVVIGNPPYINNRNLSDNEKAFFEDKYQTAYQQHDIYVLFYELGVKLLKEGGYLGFITPNKFAIKKYGMPLRKLFLEYRIVKIVDVSQLRVFSEVSTYPYIVILQKVKPDQNKVSLYFPSTPNLNQMKKIKLDQNKLKPGEPFIFTSDVTDLSIFDKIQGKKLINIYRAKPTSKNIGLGKATAITNKEIERYRLLNSNKKILEKPLWSVKVPAILMKKICFVPTATILNDSDTIPVNTVYVIHSKDIRIHLNYLLAIINSKLIGYYTRKKYGITAMRGGFIELRTFEIEDLPIKQIPESKQQPVIVLVDKILYLNKRLNEIGDKKTMESKKIEDEIRKLDDEIDEIVYKIYGITSKEKKVIEASLT